MDGAQTGDDAGLPRRIVVVVPAHNERERLPACLTSLKSAADRVATDVTVIVVLDACTDDSHAQVGSFARAVHIEAHNVGAARGAGFMAVPDATDRRTWYATTDADSTVRATWLSDQMNHYRRGVHAVVGTVDVEWRYYPLDTQRAYKRLYARHGEANHRHVHGANLGIRADVYWRIGGFRPLCTREDVDLVDRLVRADARIAWDAGNPVMTSDRPDPRVRGGFGDYVSDLIDQQ